MWKVPRSLKFASKLPKLLSYKNEQGFFFDVFLLKKYLAFCALIDLNLQETDQIFSQISFFFSIFY